VDLSVKLAREMTGRCVELGICERTTTCLDYQPLASSFAGAPTGVGSVTGGIQPPPPAIAAQLGNNNGHGMQGAMMAHYPNQDTRKIPSL
jgi:hypothetical protein